MAHKSLDTVDDVIAALGGRQAVYDLLGAKPSTISMWKSAGSFPSNTYVVMTDALRSSRKTAPASLWGMKVPSEASQ